MCLSKTPTITPPPSAPAPSADPMVSPEANPLSPAALNATSRSKLRINLNPGAGTPSGLQIPLGAANGIRV